MGKPTAREKKSTGKPRALNSEGPQSIQVTGLKPQQDSFYKNTLTLLFFKPVFGSLVGGGGRACHLGAGWGGIRQAGPLQRLRGYVSTFDPTFSLSAFLYR